MDEELKYVLKNIHMAPIIGAVWVILSPIFVIYAILFFINEIKGDRDEKTQT
jgi:hypothetical protein